MEEVVEDAGEGLGQGRRQKRPRPLSVVSPLGVASQLRRFHDPSTAKGLSCPMSSRDLAIESQSPYSEEVDVEAQPGSSLRADERTLDGASPCESWVLEHRMLLAKWRRALLDHQRVRRDRQSKSVSYGLSAIGDLDYGRQVRSLNRLVADAGDDWLDWQRDLARAWIECAQADVGHSLDLDKDEPGREAPRRSSSRVVATKR